MVKDMDTRLRIQRPTREAWHIAEVPYSASPTKTLRTRRKRSMLRAGEKTSAQSGLR
jgi:hypothetical protein